MTSLQSRWWISIAVAVCVLSTSSRADAQAPAACARTIVANVVALDQPFFWNRLGVVQPQGMIYALRRNVIPIQAFKLTPHGDLQNFKNARLVAGQVQLRPDVRPRPIVLRMNVGDCLQINFQNLLAPTPPPGQADFDEQPATRTASIHVTGLQLVTTIRDDGSFVGKNASSLVAPGGTITYKLFAQREGVYALNSTAAMTGGEGDGGQGPPGLFGAVVVEPRAAEWYRSQVTRADLQLATTGTTADGHPIINYQAVYPTGHPLAGLPILNMLKAGEIVHSDIRAIITGPNAGRFPAGTFPPNPVYPDREQPFREFVTVYHDEIGARQAFAIFEDPGFELTLEPGKDGFAINYGTGGIAAEILANRFLVGPVWDCTECKFEEFFLSSWSLGDVAMVVDVPANVTTTTVNTGGAPVSPTGLPPRVLENGVGCLQGDSTCAPGQLVTGPKATKAFFPEDPSNVYSAYIGDHTKFRIVHGGVKEHHIHHQHTHQWLHTPDSDNSTYLDSQAFGPGASFTLEMVHNGAGNRNQAVGDSIFHCHFYPHFAQGMWGMWRVLDTFEAGTLLDANGRPAPGSRAYPDGEIVAGTPIPAVVPLPTLPMAPLPQAQVQIVQVPGQPGGQVQVTGTGNPGYPFFVPGVAGHRPPHPPLDTIDDGGLPRHVISGGTFHEVHTRLDFSKELLTAVATQLPEAGTPVEQAAMAYHEQRLHPTFKPDGTPSSFITNGLPRVAGAPFAEPCIDDNGRPIGSPRLYKAADIQIDAKVNKAGWHSPQNRMGALWADVAAFLAGQKPPEPLFFRANTNDCITYQLVNLVPSVYELDDFQVRTPTDVLGQHIHLVKFDVTASDGAGNGWNYEDASFSPDEVRERIAAINAAGGLRPFTGNKTVKLTAKAHPFFGPGPNNAWLGAQTTVQRWFADNVLNNAGQDRTLRTVFTHDHFGPSTHQQNGLYMGLVVEPQGSRWRNPETGEFFGGRFDGGPTSFRADILTANVADSYREFLIEFDDHRPAYLAGGGRFRPFPGVTGGKAFADPANAINTACRDEVLEFGLVPAPTFPDGSPLPCPTIISANDTGIFTTGYRNEPVPLRVRDPNKGHPTTLPDGRVVTAGEQAAGDAGDLSKVFLSNVQRADPAFNVQPTFYPPLTGGVQPGDPFTPLLRAYENDKVQLRWLIGAHEEGHNTSVHAVKWFFEPSDRNSGFRNSQMMGISEHFEFLLADAAAVKGNTPFADYLYMPGASADDLWHGLWGLMRVYNTQGGLQPDLLTLPNNPDGKAPTIANPQDFTASSSTTTTSAASTTSFAGGCPNSSSKRQFHVTAVTAQQAVPGGALVYNPRTVTVTIQAKAGLAGGSHSTPLIDPTAILYVRSEDLDATGKLKPGVPIEPLILRAAAGDCIDLTLTNNLPAQLPDALGFNTMPPIVNFFNANQVAPSNQVGLHPQLVGYNVLDSDGANVGFNPIQTAGPGASVSYEWYAGDVVVCQGGLPADKCSGKANGTRLATPIEFGAINLISSDRIKHSNKGAIGALVIEPLGSSWVEDATSRAAATVTKTDGSQFRDFVVLVQNDINMQFADRTPVPNVAGEEDPEDSGQKAVNYRTEPMWIRIPFPPDAPLEVTNNVIFTNVLSNGQVGGDPVTPIFTANAGREVRFRVLNPQGHPRNNVFVVHGHAWQEEPFVNGSTAFGNNPFSEVKGSEMGIGPSYHFNAIPLNGAGGNFKITGDYLYRTQASFPFDGGIWGIFRVTP